jgi:hypothetical protein
VLCVFWLVLVGIISLGIRPELTESIQRVTTPQPDENDLIREVLWNPTFHKLPLGLQKKIHRKVDPNFATLADTEQNKVISIAESTIRKNADPTGVTRFWEQQIVLAMLPPIIIYVGGFWVIPWIVKGFRLTEPNASA